jgi:RND family efflux transporter MFP subunit
VDEKSKVADLSIRRRGTPVKASKRPSFLTALFRPHWLLLIAGAAAGAYYFGFRERPVAVTAITVGPFFPAQAYTLLNATGYVIPQTKADIASKATGRLEKLEWEEGSPVKAGQVIARLESQDVVAALNQATANVGVAQTELAKALADLKEANFALRRAQDLVEKKFVSRELYDAAVARQAKAVASVDSARAGIAASEAAQRAAQVAVDYTLIKAPFDGVILKKHADVGDVVAPFAATKQSKGAVVSIADLRTLEVEADVSESNLYKVVPAQPCEIQLDAVPNPRFRGEVHRIMPTVDKSKATVVVKVRFLELDPRVLPDMSAKVAFLSRNLSPAERQPVLSVAAAAVLQRENQTKAFLLDGERVKLVRFDAGERLGDVVPVRGGLRINDRAILNPPPNLQDGALVRVGE